jgi:hypothetical protein
MHKQTKKKKKGHTNHNRLNRTKQGILEQLPGISFRGEEGGAVA